MFIRIKSTPNSQKKSVQIVASIRDGDKVKQRIVRHVGCAFSDMELGRLKDLAEYIKANLEAEQQPALFSPEDMAAMAISARKDPIDDNSPINVNLRELKEEHRTVLGIHEVYGKVYEDLGFNRAIPNPARTKKANEVLYQMVMARIANPTSKREAAVMLEREFGVSIDLQHIYRMMDKLDDKAIERIQQLSLEGTQALLRQKINVLFYDCTTLYFESFTEDELKQNGYSKDCKFNQAQVLLALMVTEEGLPVGYEVFPGATFEGHTLIPTLEDLKKKYDINRVIFVADRGLLSSVNLDYLESSGFDYVVGARLRSLSKQQQEAILAFQDYQPSPYESDTKFANFETENNRRLIVHYNDTRARKDAHEREKAIDKLRKKLGKSKDPKSLLNNYGYKKYLNITGEAEITLNEEKLAQESRWDGILGVITNVKDLPAEDVLNHYRSLWQIEESFRITKHDLKVRPVYHWNPKRIRAHIAICYMAFTCVRNLMYRVKHQYQPMSCKAIRQELRQVQLSFLKHQWTKKRYCVPSKVSDVARKLYHIAGIKISTTPFELIQKSPKE